ncbi:alkaline phosphatase [Streptomyces sp. NPDC093228]|uniref:alkaline phosphatase n=2 Tax=Streptomyces TaxID=1883 RepID=UPI000ABCBA68|nr:MULTISPECIES: alkaline phosphatase [unclassified Streptomyces]MDX3259063.1 alkaline phosphatase [Streptomyces sp. MI02-2A]REE62008.1 alkaline phosphatase [Streptomyces sp. 3212.3]
MSKNVRGMRWGAPAAAASAAVVVTMVLNPTLGASASAPQSTAKAKAPAAKNVIFINGDGMGAAFREAARLHLAGLQGQLTMDRLPVSGQLTTTPDDPKAIVTDSAAAATAWATGEKTYNGAISVDPDGNPLPTLGAQAKAAGKATGLVTTAQVTDASPAAFFSNTADRGKQDEIARQYLEVSKPDVILGGGEDWWLPADNAGAYPDKPAEDTSEGSRGTKGNLIAKAQRSGYTYVNSAKGLDKAKGGKLLGLFSNEEMFQQRPEGQGDVYSPVVDLATMTSKALNTLDKNKKGFFLMIEEEGTDEFAHSNNGARVLQSMQQLEKAVAVARSYQATHPDTLIVVTGDHETGGLSVEENDAADESGSGISVEDGPFTIHGSDRTFTIDWTTSGHTSVDVPVTAAGPLANQFTGKHANTYVHDVLSQILAPRH